MRWLVKSDDVENCKKALDEFAVEFNKVFVEEIKKFRYRPVKKFIPDIVPVVYEDKDGVIFGIPLKLPDFKQLRSIIAKLTGRPVGQTKWQKKTTENLIGYLSMKGIKFESVEYVGD